MRYKVGFSTNEIFITEFDNCQAEVCTCMLDDGLKCSYTLQDAQRYVAVCYQHIADQVQNMSTEDFKKEFLKKE